MDNEKLTEETLSEISDAIINGEKIQAIKLYRDATGEGLKEAKEAIEELTSKLSERYPEIVKQQSGGCASVIVVGILGVYAIYRFSPWFTI